MMTDVSDTTDVGASTRREVSSLSQAVTSSRNDLLDLKDFVLQLDARVTGQKNVVQDLEARFREHVSNVDWTTYTQELSKACQEIKEWRESIENERKGFVSSMKEELQDSMSDRFHDLTSVKEAVQTLDTAMLELRRVCGSSDIEKALFERVGLLEHHLQDLASAVISESKVHGEAQHEEVSDQCGEILNSKGDVSSEQQQQVDGTSKMDILELSYRLSKADLRMASLETLNAQLAAAQEQTSQEISKFNSSLQGLQHDLVTECNLRRTSILELSNRLESPTSPLGRTRGPSGGDDADRVSSATASIVSELVALQQQFRHGLECEAKERADAISNLSGKLDVVVDGQSLQNSMLQSLQNSESSKATPVCEWSSKQMPVHPVQTVTLERYALPSARSAATMPSARYDNTNGSNGRQDLQQQSQHTGSASVLPPPYCDGTHSGRQEASQHTRQDGVVNGYKTPQDPLQSHRTRTVSPLGLSSARRDGVKSCNGSGRTGSQTHRPSRVTGEPPPQLARLPSGNLGSPGISTRGPSSGSFDSPGISQRGPSHHKMSGSYPVPHIGSARAGGISMSRVLS